MCLKIGGWVRAEYAYGDNGNMTNGPWAGQASSRSTSNSTFRARGYITADARNQTEYGTVRSYIAVGLSTSDLGLNTAANQFSANRAFIQWAGFTVGIAQSFFDFYSQPATSYWGSYPASDTGDPGWLVMGYTAQFGNGFSATISAEERRITQIINASGVGFANFGVVAPGALAAGITAAGSLAGSTAGIGVTGGGGLAAGAGAYGGFQAPDIVGNLRVDQAWGSAQIMGALHDVNASYYGPFAATGGVAPGVNGFPSEKVGWAAGAGFKLNTPWLLNWLGTGAGDYFQTQVTYSQGAVKYVFQPQNFNYGIVDGNTMGYGVLSDAVYGGFISNGTATSLQLTTAWNVNAAYEHFWNPRWRTSLYGGYAQVEYDGAANNMLCAAENGLTTSALQGVLATRVLGCDNNWNYWWIGTRTQWNVTKDFYMGLDVLYSKISSATPNSLNTFPVFTAAAGTVVTGQALPIPSSSCATSAVVGAGCRVSDVDAWQFRFRVHRDFYP